MEKFRINNDLSIFWSITNKDGSPYSLSDKTVRLFVTHPRGRMDVTSDITVQDNVICWLFRGSRQRYLGTYKITIEIQASPADRTIRKDIPEAFELVSSTRYEQTEIGRPEIDESGELTLATSLDIFQIMPIIPQVGPNRNWWVDGVDTGKSSVGPQGIQGPQGPEGPQGVQGIQGLVGLQGPVGPVGPQGEQGPAGPEGPQGPKGDQGNSGYTGAAGELEVVNNLTQGGATAALSAEMGKVLDTKLTELSERIDDIGEGVVGPQGPQGEQGPAGPEGPQGPKGDQGNSGYTGAAGELEIVNNLTQGGATAALSAEMGKVLSAENMRGEIMYVSKGIGKNLLDTSSLIHGYCFKADGSYFNNAADGNLNHTNYIKIKPSTIYTTSTPLGTGFGMSYAYHCFYDADFKIISGASVVATTATFESPSNAAYIRCSIRTSHIDKAQLEEGSTKTQYEKYNPISLYVEDIKSAIKDVNEIVANNEINSYVPITEVSIDYVSANSVQSSIVDELPSGKYLIKISEGTASAVYVYYLSGYTQAVKKGEYFFVDATSPIKKVGVIANATVTLEICAANGYFLKEINKIDSFQENALGLFYIDDVPAYTRFYVEKVFLQGTTIYNAGVTLVFASDSNLTNKVTIQKGEKTILEHDMRHVQTGESAGQVLFYTDGELLNCLEASQSNEKIDISLPNTIYAVVGDTLQIFFRGLMSIVEPYQYDILVSCNKGKQYPRYFEYTPTLADVGETTFKISVKNSNGFVLAEKSCKLITKAAPSSTRKLNIACFGDSLTEKGTWCAEAFRRLTQTDGDPIGLGLGNINFVGKKTTDSGANYYGEGGWRWNHYVTQGERAYRFYVTNVNLLSLGSQYTNNGSTFTIKEINITEGVGNILCSVVGANAPQSSGVLTLVSGNGDVSVSFTSNNLAPTNPLWDATNNKMSFIPYANEYADGQLDIVYVLLGWNDVHRESYPYPTMMADCKTFIDTLHSEFPNAKVKLMGLQVCSINGGMGANYGATGSNYADTFGTIRKLIDLNQAYKDFAESSAYSSFVEYVDIASQFDSENNMPYAETKVNTRSSLTERRGTNGVHPSTDGYMQIADVVYRNIIANL